MRVSARRAAASSSITATMVSGEEREETVRLAHIPALRPQIGSTLGTDGPILLYDVGLILPGSQARRMPAMIAFEQPELFEQQLAEPVSYTHLRAHETPEHLVCRL